MLGCGLRCCAICPSGAETRRRLWPTQSGGSIRWRTRERSGRGTLVGRIADGPRRISRCVPALEQSRWPSGSAGHLSSGSDSSRRRRRALELTGLLHREDSQRCDGRDVGENYRRIFSNWQCSGKFSEPLFDQGFTARIPGVVEAAQRFGSSIFE
jgi:hypothetical protein